MKAKKNLIIVGDRILVEPDEGADKTSSGLYLPQTVIFPFRQMKVIMRFFSRNLRSRSSLRRKSI
jgi:hypothetical protein